MDWPATIGIDNLKADGLVLWVVLVPEPGAITLFSAALAAMAGMLRRRFRAA